MPATPPRRLDLASGGALLLPAWHHEAERADAVIVLMAALGVSARFYVRLADALSAQGFHVLLLEQRGHGESPLRPGFRRDWGFREPLLGEIRSALRWARERYPALPLYLMGHSLGGHYAAMSVGLDPHAADGVVLVACSTPFIGAFRGATRAKLAFLRRIIPISTRLLGFFPGDRIGFGGREARGLMRDWLAFSRSNRYRAAGIDDDLEAGVARYRGQVLSLRFTEDEFAPELGVRAITRKFERAAVTERLLGRDDLAEAPDHFRWARSPSGVVRELVAWHAENQKSRISA